MKVELPVGNFYDDANRSGYWEAHGWDLLIDYDHTQDVPGAFYGKPSWSMEPDPDRGRGLFETHWVRIHKGPPDVARLHDILAARLSRSGHVILAWDFRGATNGWHLKIRLDPTPSPIEAVALQAILGSDPLRESCNLQRAREVESWARDAEEGGSEIGHAAATFWRERWNVLYKPNPERKKVPDED